jgi:hypothetical protein
LLSLLLVRPLSFGGLALAVVVYGGAALLLDRGEVRTLLAALQRRKLV